MQCLLSLKRQWKPMLMIQAYVVTKKKRISASRLNVNFENVLKTSDVLINVALKCHFLPFSKIVLKGWLEQCTLACLLPPHPIWGCRQRRRWLEKKLQGLINQTQLTRFSIPWIRFTDFFSPTLHLALNMQKKERERESEWEGHTCSNSSFKLGWKHQYWKRDEYKWNNNSIPRPGSNIF